MECHICHEEILDLCSGELIPSNDRESPPEYRYTCTACAERLEAAYDAEMEHRFDAMREGA